jgi:hypothetical protein
MELKKMWEEVVVGLMKYFCIHLQETPKKLQETPIAVPICLQQITSNRLGMNSSLRGEDPIKIQRDGSLLYNTQLCPCANERDYGHGSIAVNISPAYL